MWQSCGVSAIRTHDATGDYLRLFERDRHVYSWAASVLQAMLSNINLLQDLNDRMIASVEKDDSVELAWLIGRAIRRLIVVQPLEVIDDYDYDLDDDDFSRRLR